MEAFSISTCDKRFFIDVSTGRLGKRPSFYFSEMPVKLENRSPSYVSFVIFIKGNEEK